MHLHTTFEAHATMRSQAFMAKKLGIEALFITDHDTRMGYLEKRVNCFSYQNGEALQIINQTPAGWYDENEAPLSPVQKENEWLLPLIPGKNARFFADRKFHQASLLADLTFFIDLLLPDTWDGGLRLDFELSLTEDSEDIQHFYYDIGNCPKENPRAFRKILPMEKGRCRLQLPLSQDILSFDPLGQDHCFVALQLRSFGKLSAYYLGHKMERKYAAEAVRQKQQETADRISEKTGVLLHAATEITGAGQHKISFSKCVPLIDYPAHDYQVSWEMAAAHVKKHGGIHAYNHMFEFFKRREWTGEEREQLIQSVIAALTESRAEDAVLMEVGFPEGRSGFSAEEHLRVWDALAMEGILLSGYGDNDNHNSRINWLDGNNFSACWYAEGPEREAIEKALPTGNGYTLDPARLQGTAFEFHLEKAPMGGILIGGTRAEAMVSFKNLPEAGEIRIMAGGKCIEKKDLAPGDHALSFTVKKNAVLCPVRIEFRGEDGRILLLSNPVYWTDADLPGYPERIRIHNS